MDLRFSILSALDTHRQHKIKLVARFPFARQNGVTICHFRRDGLSVHRERFEAADFRRRRIKPVRLAIGHADKNGKLLRLFRIDRDRNVAAPRIIRFLHHLHAVPATRSTLIVLPMNRFT
jgi:hypothetical protein